MKKQHLKLYPTPLKTNTYRAIIKTSHGRLIYIEVCIKQTICTIIDYFYVDRVRSGKYYSAPSKMITVQFEYSELLQILASQADRLYYGIDIIDSYSDLSKQEFIDCKLAEYKRGYKFLIFIGSGKIVDGIPEILKTRLKNKLHRSIYLELNYCENGRGVVADCFYYDRDYKARTKVMPESLSSIFFEYTRKRILDMINSELNTAFTDIIFVTDNSLDINNMLPLCGNV